MALDRRQLLKALGLGASALALAQLGVPGRVRSAEASGAPAPPKRVVFFITPHGFVPKAWKMPIANGSTNAIATRELISASIAEASTLLRPLHAFRDRLLVIEGLANTTVLQDRSEVLKRGGDDNDHNLGIAHLLTGVRAKQNGGPCTGGGRSIDQLLAQRMQTPGRFASRVYTFDYAPNAVVAPFSFLGPGQASPTVSDPATAYADLMSRYLPPASEGDKPVDREAKIKAMRGAVLETARREYELLAPNLDAEGRRKLDAHRELIVQLQSSVTGGSTATCKNQFDRTGHKVTQFMRLIKMALACDLTRVITFSPPVPECPELGFPAKETLHTYAHQSIEGATSCGLKFDPVAERVLIEYGNWCANHFTTLLRELDSVIEGSGTMLDNTTVVWLSELATPTHRHEDTFTLVAGGSYFKRGQYIRYPQNLVNPLQGAPRLGPSQNRFFHSLLRAMGQDDTSFGLEDFIGNDGHSYSQRGPLSELHRV
jgi:Protein of unknown function (DUF1552)